MSEARVVRACVRELNARGILHFNLGAANGITGLPDRLALPRHHLLPLEFKDPEHGRVSPRQAWMHERFAAAGWPVLVVRHVDELRRALDEIEGGCNV